MCSVCLGIITVDVRTVDCLVLFFFLSLFLFHQEVNILLVSGGGCSVSGGSCPDLMDKWISYDGSVRRPPNLQPPRHESYPALNSFGYAYRRGSPTQSIASP